MSPFEEIWQRIVLHEGGLFHQKQGGEFVYKIKGNSIIPNRTNVVIGKSELEKAWFLMPVEKTTTLQHLRAPSYLFAILN